MIFVGLLGLCFGGALFGSYMGGVGAVDDYFADNWQWKLSPSNAPPYVEPQTPHATMG